MPPKLGNAFAQQKEVERLKKIQEQSTEEHSSVEINSPEFDQVSHGPLTQQESRAADAGTGEVIKTTTLEVPATRADLPSTAGTTMAALLGPETEQEKRGREMVKAQRDSMEAKLVRKRSRKSRPSTDSSSTTVKHLSAQPKPLFHGKFNKIKHMIRKPGWAKGPTAATAALDKALPPISTPEAAHAREVSVYIPGAYVVSPPFVPGSAQMMSSPAYTQYDTEAYSRYNTRVQIPPTFAQHMSFAKAHKQANKAHDEQVQQNSPADSEHRQDAGPDGAALQDSPSHVPFAGGPFEAIPVLHPNGYIPHQSVSKDQGWPLPSPRSNTGHFSALTNETAPSQYLSAGNQGMVFSNHFLTPTRAGDFATYGQPKLVQNHPSMMSMAASVVDPTSPVAVQPPKRTSALGVVPEVQETKELQAANASDTEKHYNQDAWGSQSDRAIVRSTPRIPRSRSVPNINIASFVVDPAAAARRASTGTDLFFERFTTAPAAPPNAPVAATDALIDELYLQLRQDMENVKTDILSRVKYSRRAVQSDLVHIHEQIMEMQKRQERMEGKLDEILGALAGRERSLPGGGVAGRLGAPGPHTPWGSQSMNGREREVSAGIPGGLEGAQEWYRAARKA